MTKSVGLAVIGAGVVGRMRWRYTLPKNAL